MAELILKSLPFATRYFAGSDGFIYSGTQRLRGFRIRNLYFVVDLRAGGKTIRLLVHRIIASMFVGPCPFIGAEARHLDGNPVNNIPSNLAWGTHAENMADMVRHGRTNARPEIKERLLRGVNHPMRLHPELVARGEQAGKAKLTEHHVRAIMNRLANGERQADLAREYGVTDQLVYRIKRGRCWKHLWEVSDVRRP